MKKKIKLVTICVLAVIMVFANVINVFAANSDMSDFPLTIQGHSGNFPWAAQLVLKYNNVKNTSQTYLEGSVDGIFGGDTFNATKKFQNDYKDCGGADGKIGPNTWKQLRLRLISAGGTAYYTSYRPGTRTTADYFMLGVSPQTWSFRKTSTDSYQTLKS